MMPTREEIGAAMRRIKANPPTYEEQKQSFVESVVNDVDGLFPPETGDEKWERLFRETTPEQWERLGKLFDEDEAERRHD